MAGFTKAAGWVEWLNSERRTVLRRKLYNAFAGTWIMTPGRKVFYETGSSGRHFCGHRGVGDDRGRLGRDARRGDRRGSSRDVMRDDDGVHRRRQYIYGVRREGYEYERQRHRRNDKIEGFNHEHE